MIRNDAAYVEISAIISHCYLRETPQKHRPQTEENNNAAVT
jgi:hypothetical protein